MKKSLFILTFILTTFTAFTQNTKNNKTDDYKNWIVDLSQAESSFDNIKIDKVELNDQYTVIHMSFRNMGFRYTLIEACNTFHLESKRKKIASFVKAENIPTRYVNRTGFSCADEETAMRVRPGQFVRFRIYFTRIPQYLNNIDVIEYNGRESCEFDVWNLNISRKEPLKTPSIAAVTPKKIAPPPLSKKPQTPAKTPPAPPTYASKTPTPSQPKETPKPIEVKPTAPNTSNVEKRNVSVVKEYNVASRRTIQLEIWDNDQEDGDVVSIMLNKRWIIKGVKVTKNKKKIEIPLAEGENVLTLHADNLGTAPPNTAAVSFWDDQGLQTIVLNSDFNKSEAIKFIRK